ncbi:MAG TPA: hypothetical protein VGC76_14125 [Pyrinomonadaceae bacterium]
MKEEFIKESFGRLKELRIERESLDNQRRAISQQLDTVDRAYSSLEHYLRMELTLSNDQKGLEELRQIREEEIAEIDSTQENLDTTLPQFTETEFNKTQFLVNLIYRVNSKGVTSSDLFQFTQETDKRNEFKLPYVRSVLSRLNQKGLAEKIDDKYFLTDKGIEYWQDINK